MQILESQNLLRLSDGALVVDVAQAEDKAPVPPVIVKKSDHSNIYATTDLATLLQRQRDFAPDRIWYVVDLSLIHIWKARRITQPGARPQC